MKKQKLMISILIIMVLMVLTFVSVGVGAEKYKIAFVMKTLTNPFFLEMEKGARKAEKELSDEVELIVLSPEKEIDYEKQMQIFETLITMKIDAICITLAGSIELVPVIKKANEAGIPVITVDVRPDEETLRNAGAEVATFMGSDNYQGGQIAAEALAKSLNYKGKVAILEGIRGNEVAEARLKGFLDKIKEYKDIKVVSSQSANWEREQGLNVTQNILQSFPDLNGIFGCNDIMSLGAIQAVELSGKLGQVNVIGFDAIEEAKTAIKEGRMLGSVAQYPGIMGEKAVKMALDVLKGKKVEKEIPIPIKLITKENL